MFLYLKSFASGFAYYPIVRHFTSLVVAFLLIFHAPALFAAEKNSSTLAVGFQDAQGRNLYLHDFKGRPVLLNIWATWCTPCVREMPSLASLQEDYRNKGLVVVAVSEDEDIAAASQFYKRSGITSLAPYYDKGHLVFIALGIPGVPVSIMLNRQGVEVKRIEGPVDWQSPITRKTIDILVNTP